jgi:pimeloyl-ACP methyl ester carboxylesterase
MTLAAADPRVKGLVLISTPGRPLADVLADDFLKEIPDPARGQALAEAVRTTAAQVVSTGQVPPAEMMAPELRAIFAPDVAGFLRGLFTFDPAVEATRVQVPALIVRGGGDTSITDLDVTSLRQSFPRSEALVSPVGSNSLALPPGQEGVFHNPARHGSTRDGDALAAINNWLKGNLR